MSSRQEEKAKRKAEREAKQAQEAQAATRARRLRYGGGVLAAAAIVAAIVVASSGGGGSSTPSTSRDKGGKPALKTSPLATLGKLQAAPPAGAPGPEGVAVPTGPSLAAPGAGSGNDIDGISCLSNEQLQFHIHAHVTVFVGGQSRQIPAGIGIAGAQPQLSPRGVFVGSGSCFYWLHVHAADGIIHIESPEQRTYTLGDLFDIWGQPLSPTQVGTAKGRVVALYNGQTYVGNPRNIPLNSHAQIQLEVGRPLVAPVTSSFPNGL